MRGEDAMSEQQRQISRRRLIKGAGATAVGVAASSLLSSCGIFRGGGGGSAGGGGGEEPLKIGLLVPTSGVYTVLGEDMQAGFQLYLDQNDNKLGGREVDLIVEDEGSTPEVPVQKAQKLIRKDQVAMVTGIVSSASALGLRDLFDEEQVPLIVSNAGANELTRDLGSPYIFRTSFSNYQPNFAIGEWFYDNVEKDGVYLFAPDYEAGAEQMAAFKESFEGAGGKIAGETYPPFQTTDDYQPFLSKARNAKAVYAFFSGAEAVTFVTQYEQFGLKDSIPLLGPGFLTDEGVLPAQKEAAIGIRTSLHYTPLLDNPTNKQFVEDYQAANDELPTTFVVQSYDAAQLIDQALTEVDGDTSDVEAVSEALAGVGTIDSPRGTFEMDSETHNPVQMFYLRDVKDVGGQLVNEVVEELGEVRDPGPGA
jgi:branched-chain amino acid transport system substrate-binding protein